MNSGETAPAPTLLGALLGWRRVPMGLGAILRVQVTREADRSREDAIREFDVALTATQLRQLGEDLIRAADEHDGRPHQTKLRWWQR